jgi:hypothetical protein
MKLRSNPQQNPQQVGNAGATDPDLSPHGSSLFSVEWVRGNKKVLPEVAVSWVEMGAEIDRNGMANGK